MSDIPCHVDKMKYTIFVTAAACSYRGCTLAIGTSDNLVLLYQIGKRGFDIPEDEQVEEEERSRKCVHLTRSGSDAGEGGGYEPRSGGVGGPTGQLHILLDDHVHVLAPADEDPGGGARRQLHRGVLLRVELLVRQAGQLPVRRRDHVHVLPPHGAAAVRDREGRH